MDQSLPKINVVSFLLAPVSILIVIIISYFIDEETELNKV